MLVRPKVCVPYITGHRQQLPEKKTWLHKDSKKNFRPKRAGKRLWEFLRAYSKPSRAKRKQYEFLASRKAPKPLTEKEREAWAKKEFIRITRRGLGELAMFICADEFEEWWKGQKEYVNEGGEWIEKRQKGERHRRADKNWKKALPVINENREEKKRTEPDRFIKSFGPSSYSQARRKS